MMQKNNKTNDSKSLVKQEQSEANKGKLDQVPWSAVKSYLNKYKGIGRLEEKFNSSDQQQQQQQGGGRMMQSMDGRGSREVNGYDSDERNGGSIRSRIRDFLKSKGSRKVKAAPNHDSSGEAPGEGSPAVCGHGRKRKGGSFYPVNSSDDEEYGMEALEHGEDNAHNYAARYSNMLSRSIEPNHSEFDAISNIGSSKQNINTLEVQLAERAMEVLANDHALELFQSRYDQLMMAQEAALEIVDSNQPGTFQFDDTLVYTLENMGASERIDLQVLDSMMTQATLSPRYFSSFFMQLCQSLERNFNFDLDYAQYFTNCFTQYLITFCDLSNCDYICGAIKACKSDVDVVAKFIELNLYAAEMKRDVIERQVQYGTLVGTPSIFTDVQLNTILAATTHIRKTLAGYIQLLQSQTGKIKQTNSTIKSLKGSGMHGILGKVRNAIAQRHHAQVASDKFGSGMAQSMSQVPSEQETSALTAHNHLKGIAADDDGIRMQKVIILAEIERFKATCRDAPFVNMAPIDDLEKLTRFLLNQTNVAYHGNASEPIDLNAQVTGEDIWLAEASRINTGELGFTVDQKIVMCQGYIGALKIGEQRCNLILNNLMRRIGYDPLAPKIITQQMSEIFADLGFYVEENVGLYQAQGQLAIKSKKTDDIDADLAQVITRQSGGDQVSESYVQRILDSILGNFAGTTSMQGQSEYQLQVLSVYVCASCNTGYSLKDGSVPITLPCGDTQCITCSCTLKQCFKCKAPVENVPSNPSMYNPTVHCPLDFLSMLKINAADTQLYMVSSLLTNNILGEFSPSIYETIAKLNTIMTELYMHRPKSSECTDSKLTNFFVDCMSCTSVTQFLRIIVSMLDKDACEQLCRLCALALQMADFYAGGAEGKFICSNVISALVSAARVPTQGLAVQVLLEHDSVALGAYCSGDNVAFMRRIFDTRREFLVASHAFKYKDIGPLIINMVATTIDYLGSEEFDDVIPRPTRIFLLKEFTDIHQNMQMAIDGGNYKYLDHECKDVLKLFFNEVAVYLKPIATMKDSAVEKCNTLWNFYNDTIIHDICKKYPMARNLECDPALICTKYAETMVETSRHHLADMYMHTKTGVSSAIAQNAACVLNSRIEQARSLTYVNSGTYFDMPTDSSVYKNLPPIICAMSQYTPGNNPALPLYQYSMSEGAMLDNPFRVTVPETMELCHTEGRLFYTGYDGFLEEYSPLTFDPVLRGSSGIIMPPESMLDNSLVINATMAASAPAGRFDKIRKHKVPQLSFSEQLNLEKSRGEQLRRYNQGYYQQLFSNIIDDPLVRQTIVYQFGAHNYKSLHAARELAGTGRSHPLSSSISRLSGQSMRDGGSIETHKYFEDKKRGLTDLMKHKASKAHKDLDSKRLLEPILKACGVMRMRKNIHDVHDHSVMQHTLRKDRGAIERDAPQCEHCGGRESLKIHRHSNEVSCSGCYSGRGLTKTRKIMNSNNTDDLATSNHPAHRAMSAAYNKYVMRDKKAQQPSNGGDIQPANSQWSRFVESAKPYFRNHPEAHLKNFTHHKVTEPIPDNHRHNLKNVALMGGRLHTMLDVEKKNMPRHHLDNLKHNFAWYAAHLKPGAGRLRSHNLVGAGDDFPSTAQNMDDARDHVHALAASRI